MFHLLRAKNNNNKNRIVGQKQEGFFYVTYLQYYKANDKELQNLRETLRNQYQKEVFICFAAAQQLCFHTGLSL